MDARCRSCRSRRSPFRRADLGHGPRPHRHGLGQAGPRSGETDGRGTGLHRALQRFRLGAVRAEAGELVGTAGHFFVSALSFSRTACVSSSGRRI